jgi:hypothetical protein
MKEQIKELVEGGLSMEEATELVDRLDGRTTLQNTVDRLNKVNSKKVLSIVVSDHTRTIGEVNFF